MRGMDKKGLLIILVGPSGSGKGTVLRELLQEDANTFLSVSATTRKPREGEQDGVHYYFTEKARFEQMIADGEMLEYASYCDNYYGTPRKAVQDHLDVGHNVILEIEMQGAETVKAQFPAAVMIFITPPSMAILESRLTGRGTETAEVIAARMDTARRELHFAHKCDYVVQNDTVENAVATLRAILLAHSSRTALMNPFIDALISEAEKG